MENKQNLNYWSGFIAADGCLYKRNDRPRPYINVTVASRDRHHLCELKSQLGVSNKISDYSRKNRRTQESKITFQDDYLYSYLTNNGITPRKSKTLEVSNSLCSDSSFWRGVLDGDGYLGYNSSRGYKYPMLRLTSASLRFMEQYREYILSLVPGIENKITSDSGVYRLTLTSKKALMVLGTVYAKGCYSLERKLTKLKEISNDN